MFAINSFVSDKGSSKGQTIKTVMLGDNADPRKNTHIGRSLAILLAEILRNPVLAVEFVRDLHVVAGLNPPTVYDTPATPVTPAPPPGQAATPSLTTEETIAAIHESRTIPPTDRAGKGPAKNKGGRKAKAAMQPATATLPNATVNVTVASSKDDLDSLKAEAKALKVKGAHLYKDSAKLKAIIAKAKGETVKPETPVTPVKPETETTTPPATKAAKRVLVTTALGEDNNVYVIYRTAEGTLVAVADTIK
jgi:hypothetical protein